VRPFIQYGKVPESLLRLGNEGNGSVTNISGFVYGVSATYDFSVAKSDLISYAGIGIANASGSVSYSRPVTGSQSSFTSPIFIEIGADYNFTDNITINANYKFQDLGFLSFGAEYRF
jgi:opacity protein-like surface antigen